MNVLAAKNLQFISGGEFSFVAPMLGFIFGMGVSISMNNEQDMQASYAAGFSEGMHAKYSEIYSSAIFKSFPKGIYTGAFLVASCYGNNIFPE